MKELIIQAITALFAAWVYYINNKKATKNDAESRLQKETINSLLNRVNVLEYGAEGEKFRKEIRNSINEFALIKINELEEILNIYAKSMYRENLSTIDLFFPPKIISGLTEFFKQVAEFSLTFFYSGFRQNPDTTEGQFYVLLSKDFSTIMLPFEYILKEAVKVDKCDITANKLQPILFMDLLKTRIENKPTIYQLVELLIAELVRNGIKEEKLKKIFLKFAEDFMRELKEKFVLFLDLRDFDVEFEKLV